MIKLRDLGRFIEFRNIFSNLASKRRWTNWEIVIDLNKKIDHLPIHEYNYINSYFCCFILIIFWQRNIHKYTPVYFIKKFEKDIDNMFQKDVANNLFFLKAFEELVIIILLDASTWILQGNIFGNIDNWYVVIKGNLCRGIWALLLYDFSKNLDYLRHFVTIYDSLTYEHFVNQF